MYNYSFKINYFDLPLDKQDDQYRKDFLKAFNLEIYDETKIFHVIDNIFNNLKENVQFIEILETYKKTIYNYPIDVDNNTLFTFLFSFDTFQYLHKCLSYLLQNKPISDRIINEFIEYFKKNNK